MEVYLETLRKSEQVAYLLRNLYEQYGYEKFRMSKFEEYDFYLSNRDFLGSGQILAFTDLTGKLMALKPDVTMSIVKNTRATFEQPEKLYYTESVYRASQEVREYKEIYQIGVEYIGEVTRYAQIEMITLALKSLACIQSTYILDISHVGFLHGMLDEADISREGRRTIMECIVGKNAHELMRVLTQYSVPGRVGESLLALTRITGNLQDALTQIEPLILNDAMRQAYEELCEIAAVFTAQMSALRLDFSITSASKYYNGIKLRGYVSSVPRAVLSGGRYDPLMRRMGREGLQAIGFAIYFDELERYLKTPARPGYDAIVLYDECTELEKLYALVDTLVKDGLRVCAAKNIPPHAGEARVYRLCGGAL